MSDGVTGSDGGAGKLKSLGVVDMVVTGIRGLESVGGTRGFF